MKRRTEYCGLVSEKLVGQTVTLDGWVAKRRDHGELFSSTYATAKALCK